jgi:hypothetical protein
VSPILQDLILFGSKLHIILGAFIFLAGKASDNKYSMIKREPVAAEARYEKTTILLETN